jgi:hypothetical protein
MADPNTPTRNQIARMAGNDHEMIKAIERLFIVSGSQTPADVTALTELINSTSLAAGVAENQAQAYSPQHIDVDYIDFRSNAPRVTTARRLAWSDADGTLEVGMGYDAVVQQVGLETYYRIKASADISDGDVIMFSGSVGASGVLTGEPAAVGLTDGNVIMGVATMDIANNKFGYVTAFGVVRGIDTSAFSDGDILYYDPTVAGGLTNVEPNPTEAVVIVAAVVNAGPGGSGSILVRPTSIPRFNSLPCATKTANYTATAKDATILCDASAGAFTITLLPAAGLAGHVFSIKKLDSSANAVTIAADGAETIDGNISISMAVQWTCLTVQSNGTDWFIT